MSYHADELMIDTQTHITTVPESPNWPQIKTRTTRTPAFWGYPPPPHDYPYHWVILDPKSKEDKVKLTNLKNSPKFPDEYCRRYRADTILSTDGQTDRRADGQMDKVIPVYPPFNFVEAGGIITTISLRGQWVNLLRHVWCILPWKWM